jgi:putative phosphoribosyl transferase
VLNDFFMFTDRKDGAEHLAKALSKYKNQHALVLGIPRGGIETAFYVAQALHADLGVLICRKLGAPSNPEAAIGALAEDGSLYLDPDYAYRLSDEELAGIVKEQQEEIRRRIAVYRQNKPLPDLKGRTVILVDDGIATGATLFAAVIMCRHQKAARIVLAAPVSSYQARLAFERQVDEVVILSTPVSYFAVSQAYYSFHNLTDREVLALLEAWDKRPVVKG